MDDHNVRQRQVPQGLSNHREQLIPTHAELAESTDFGVGEPHPAYSFAACRPLDVRVAHHSNCTEAKVWVWKKGMRGYRKGEGNASTHFRAHIAAVCLGPPPANAFYACLA